MRVVLLLASSSAWSPVRAPRASASCVRRAEPEDGEARNTLGDLSRSFGRQLARRVKEAKDQVNSLTGKDAYEFGDLSRWLDAKAKENPKAFYTNDYLPKSGS